MARTSEQLTNSEILWVQQGDLGVLRLRETTAPSPVSNYGLIYVKSSDNLPYYMSEGGVETAILGSGGITSLNTLTAAAQTLVTGTAGTDFAISSAVSTHTFNIPSSSALNRGLLTSADWTTFNNKVSSTRAINTTSPLAGGGDLSADRTLTVGGLSSLGAANQIVGVNAGATAWEYKTLTAGANITITPGVGTVTIASTGGGTGEAITKNINQVAHGLLVGDVVRSNGVAGQYTKAQANSAANAEVAGIVTAVADVDNFTLTMAGFVTSGVPAATAGTVMFLSPTISGALTSTEPTTAGQISKPLAIIETSASRMIFFNMRGEEITSPSSFTINYNSFVAAGGETLVAVGFSYVVGSNDLEVFLNGIRQEVSIDYTETSATQITFTGALTAGDRVIFRAIA